MASLPLRRILSLQSILVAVVPSLLAAALGFIWFFPQVSAEIDSQHRQLANAITSQVENYLSSAMNIVKGTAAIAADKELAWHDIQHVLDAQSDPSAPIKLLYVADKSGLVFAISRLYSPEKQHHDLLGLEIGHTPLFLNTVREHRALWSDTFLSIVGGGPAVAVAVPSGNNVVFGEVDTNRLTNFLKRSVSGKEQVILIIDHRGQIIADQDGRFTAQQLNVSNIPLIREGLSSSTPLTGKLQFNNQSMVGSFSKCSIIDWYVLVAQPTKSAYRPVITAEIIVGLGLLAALLTGITIAIYLSRKLAVPFEALEANARSLANGDYAGHWPKLNIAEFQRLSDDLQLMADAIHTRESLLAQSEEKFAKAFQRIPAIVTISTLADGRLVEVNETFEQLFGYSRAEVIGRTAQELGLRVDPGDRVKMVKLLKTTGIVHDIEQIFRKKTGETLIGMFSGETIELYGKQCLISMIKDITAQRQVEAALREKEAFLERVTNCVPDLIWAMDLSGRFIYANPIVERLLGWTVEEYLQLKLSDRVPHEAAATYMTMIAEELALAANPDYDRNTIRTMESEQTRKDGSAFWAETSVAFLWSDEGNPNGLIGVTRDITERKNMENALKDSEERFRQMFAQNYDAIVIIELDTHKITFANQALLDIYGYSAGEVPFLQPWDLMTRPVFQDVIKAIQKDKNKEGFFLDKYMAFKKDMTSIYISVRGKVIQMKDERVILCAIRDISRQVKLEETIKTSQAKLIQANKMTALGMLVSGVAHEINNPNQCISVNTTVLSNIWHDAAPIIQQYCAETGRVTLGGLSFQEIRDLAPQLFAGITDSSQRINTIVANMKDYVRSGSGKKAESFDMNSAITNATTILWHNIQKYTYAFRQELAEGIPPAHGNAQQIEQVVINLIMNALQALPDKSCEVCVSTAFDDTTGTVVITVKDEGRGMDRRILQRLTEPFFTTREEEGGTGLGLYISTTIIKDYHGSLEFDSEPGRGTTATIRLPVASQSEDK